MHRAYETAIKDGIEARSKEDMRSLLPNPMAHHSRCRLEVLGFDTSHGCYAGS